MAFANIVEPLYNVAPWDQTERMVLCRENVFLRQVRTNLEGTKFFLQENTFVSCGKISLIKICSELCRIISLEENCSDKNMQNSTWNFSVLQLH